MERRRNQGPACELRLRAVLDGVLDGIVTISELGCVESFNAAAQRIFGYSADEVVGNNVSMLMPEPYRTEHDSYLGNYRRSGTRKIIGVVRETVGRRKDGSTFPLDVSVTEVFLDGQRIFIGVLRDITERKAAIQEVGRFKGILDNTHDMIFMFDPETLRFVYCNNGVTETLGYSLQEFMTMRAWEISPQLPEQAFRAHVAPLLEGGRPWLRYETAHRCRDGRDLPVEVALQLVEEGRGNHLFVAVSRDLSERRKVDKMKTEFIATVSHELRTPLTSIRGALGLVRGGATGELPTQARAMVDIAFGNSERLLRLINDILDIEKLAAGSMHFDMVKAEIFPLVEQALEANQSYGDKCQVHFKLVGRRVGANASIDKDRFAQVMANLLSNAAKFSPPNDEVVVRVKRAGGVIRVSVRDHGSGIPEEFRERIFQRFSQADASDTRQKGGSGLGLSITKAIVEGMGGVIGFDSVPGRGTTFYVDLPDADAQGMAGGVFRFGPPQARYRLCYVPLGEVRAGMVLGAPVSIASLGVLRYSLPARHALTEDNLEQLASHRVDAVIVSLPDTREDEQVAVDAARVARRVLEVFSGADLSDATTAALFDQVLVYKSLYGSPVSSAA